MNKLNEFYKYGALLHKDRFVIGSGGNISVKDGSFLIIKKKGSSMLTRSKNNYIRIPFDKVGIRKNSLLSSETPLHAACYEASSLVRAVIHVHPIFSTLAAGMTSKLESPSYESDYILGKSIPVVKYIQPGSEELAQAVKKEIKKGASAVLLKRHGAISVGRTLEEAYIRMLALERACEIFFYSRFTLKVRE